MRINPVLKNEVKISCRSVKFTLVIFFYVGILSAIGIFAINQIVKEAYYRGLNFGNIIPFYTVMAIVQAILLMFIVPALTSTAICSEREKQTLDVLLSTSMSTVSIIMGKLSSSISRVILLIICTIPVYSLAFLFGGIKIQYLLELSIFFIVATIFVGTIGVFISTIVKSSKAATAIVYGIVLAIFVLLALGTIIFINIKLQATDYSTVVDLPLWGYISPTIGFISLLSVQTGEGFLGMHESRGLNMTTINYGFIISICFQLIISALLIIISAYKLNPLNKGKFKRRRKRK